MAETKQIKRLSNKEDLTALVAGDNAMYTKSNDWEMDGP